MKNKAKMVDTMTEVVDARYSSEKEQQMEASSLMDARRRRMAKLSQATIFRAKLMQLKLQMEEFLQTPVYDSKPHFK